MKSLLQSTLFVLFILLFSGTAAFAQKMTPKTQRRAKAATQQTLLKFKDDLNRIYKEDDNGYPRQNLKFVEKSKAYFYNSTSATAPHIHRSMIDTKDTLLRDVPEMMNINAFTDTLVSWYCNPDSCELGVIFDFTDISIDTLDYYMDPEIIAINLFFDVDLYAELYAPHMEKYMRKEESEEEELKEETIFFVEDYDDDWQTQTPDAAMATFIITLDGDKFTSVKIYKIFKYDPFESSLPNLRDIIKPIIASRNKMYLTATSGIGYSRAKATFDNNNAFESISDFRPGFNFDISFDYFFNDGPRKFTYGYSAGLGYSQYNASVSIKSFAQSFFAHSDELNKDFTKHLSANDIGQELSLDYIDIPVSFKVKYKPRNYINFYGDVGLAFSYLFDPSLTPAGDGDITYTGTFEYDFPNGNSQVVTYENVPYYGFTTYNDLEYSDEDPGFNSINISALVNAGAMFWITPRLSVNVEAMYRYGFLNLVDKLEDEKFVLSYGEGRVNNIFRNCSSLHTNSISVNAGISYFLRSNK